MTRKEFIAEIVNDKRMEKGAELGLWDGRTYLHLLENCPSLTMIGVDIWEPMGIYQNTDRWGNDWSVESHQNHEMAVRNGAKKYGDRAVIHKMKTVDASYLVSEAELDFVFIDADHSYDGVVADINHWKPKVKPGGLLMGHDIDWQSVRRAIGDAIGPDFVIGPDNVWFHVVS